MPKVSIYRHSDKELSKRIDQYFSLLEENPDKRGAPSDFLAFVEMDMDAAKKITGSLTDDSGAFEEYKKHARLLKKAAVKLRAHMETSPAWSGSNAIKSMFLCKQQLWDGMAYTDKQEVSNNTTGKIHVVFGSNSKESEKAFD